jgi:NADH:ubiquinone oxidoreductase subunit F (NADH-binding)/NADH:ubiquinone oxidoreductase subunit E
MRIKMAKTLQKIKNPDPKITAVLDKHTNDPSAILEIFQDIQSQQITLDQETVSDIASGLKVPSRHAWGVASFYSMLSLSSRKPDILRICDGPVCWLCGSEKLHKLAKQASERNHNWTVERSSCLGLCDRAPAALVNEVQAGPIPLDEEFDPLGTWLGKPTSYVSPRQGEKRVMLAKAGMVDPDSLDSALEHGAYQGLSSALHRTPEEVLNEVESSGLTGRGGAGFSVGRKWRFVAQASRTPKYVICNADESEPLIFKDRVLIDTNPHQILEGMAIAGYATGANEAFIYIRGEYEPQAERLERAIHQAEAAGWLGDHIQKSQFSFHIHVHRGAGAYICGEETALIESLEGKRGEPRNRPPYPPTAGYLGLPTIVNNVESYAAVPPIALNGAVWYRSLSGWSTPGTKLYMILGHVNQPGLFEAPFGITLREAIENFGGGMQPGSSFHFALTGGAAGTIVPNSLLDIPIDYTSASQGVSLGAGAFLVCDQSVSPVAFLKELLHFFAVESCGKCTPCRVGTHQAHAILSRMITGLGQAGDVAELLALAENMYDASFCGLGQSVPIPMRSALTHFANAFQEAEKSDQSSKSS